MSQSDTAEFTFTPHVGLCELWYSMLSCRCDVLVCFEFAVAFYVKLCHATLHCGTMLHVFFAICHVKCMSCMLCYHITCRCGRAWYNMMQCCARQRGMMQCWSGMAECRTVPHHVWHGCCQSMSWYVKFDIAHVCAHNVWLQHDNLHNGQQAINKPLKCNVKPKPFPIDTAIEHR